MRRLLLFLAMVTAGLTLVLLLSDDPLDTGGGEVARSASAPRDPGLEVKDDHGQTQARVTVGNFRYTITEFVEELGGERESYRVEAETGVPTSDGRYLLSLPVITLFDPPTGAWKGEVRSRRGTVITGQVDGGDLELNMGQMHAEAFSLEEDVRGEFAMDGDRLAHLEADRLDWDGAVVTGPGRVTWWRDDVRLTGLDMTWHETTGLVRYERDAELAFTDPEGGTEGTLQSPRGLVWNLPASDAGGHGHGELLGPITGSFGEGGSLSGERLLVAADDSAMTLIGGAFVELPGEWRGRADEMTVADDGAGGLELVDARGDTLIEQLDGTQQVTGWLRAPGLQQVDGVLAADDPSSWSLGGVHGRGPGLRWDRRSGRVTTSGDTVLSGQQGAMDGLKLRAQGGLDVTVPPGSSDLAADARGVLKGPVTGSQPGGNALAAQRVDIDGPNGSIVLVGKAWVRRDDQSTLTADRLELLPDDNGALEDLSAQGNVRLNRPGEDGALLVRTPRLDLTGGVFRSDERVDATQGPFTMTGVGARWDEATGELRILSGAVLDRAELSVPDPDGGPAELQPAVHLEADGGLRWIADEAAGDALFAGEGQLDGPVRGTTSDGRTLRATDRVVVHGSDDRLELRGDAYVGMGEDRWLSGDALDLVLTEGSRRVTSDLPVQFAAGTVRGEGVGLDHDEALGLTRLLSDASLEVVDDIGRRRFALACDGELRWRVPSGATDPMREGDGEAFDDVVAVDDAGSRFHTDHLVVRGSDGLVRLLGPSRMELVTPSGPGELQATDSIDVERGPDGELLRLVATGDAVGEYPGTDAIYAFSASVFALDRPKRALVFDGPLHLEQRTAAGDVRTLDGEPGSRLVALSDDQDQLVSVTGAGRFAVEANRMKVLADTIDWDMPADLLHLAGDCRLLGVAGWVRAPIIDVWPRARRYHIPLPTVAIEVDGR